MHTNVGARTSVGIGALCAVNRRRNLESQEEARAVRRSVDGIDRCIQLLARIGLRLESKRDIETLDGLLVAA